MSGPDMEERQFIHPFSQRYASAPMQYLFSAEYKFTTWRKLWIALAEGQKELGLAISDEQIQEMKDHITPIDYEMARAREAVTRHDVMAHIHTFGAACPKAKPIIHLGATSAYVGDNTDIIQIREAGILLLQRMTPVLESLKRFAVEYKDLPTLGYTHFQPAQATTVGKRACLWLQDCAMDFSALASFIDRLPFLGVKGTTGTQASFLALFDNDHAKVKQLDVAVSRKMGFAGVLPVSGQTYTRKIDSQLLSILSGLAQTAHKFANDIRLLQHLSEIEEPFHEKQVGSSAMAYKRNPMRSERLTGIARYLISLETSAATTAAEQWFERTLDDSSNRRLVIPTAFLAADSILLLLLDICTGLVVYPATIRKHLDEELPFLATENILMEAVKRGGDRQVLHERIRIHAMEAARRIKREGADNDLLQRISKDSLFRLSSGELASILNVKNFVGRAPEQTAEYIHEHIDPLLAEAETYGRVASVQLTV